MLIHTESGTRVHGLIMAQVGLLVPKEQSENSGIYSNITSFFFFFIIVSRNIGILSYAERLVNLNLKEKSKRFKQGVQIDSMNYESQGVLNIKAGFNIR